MKTEELVWVEKKKEGSDAEREIWLRPVVPEEENEIYMIIYEDMNIKAPNTLVSTRIILNNHLFTNFDSNFFK